MFQSVRSFAAAACAVVALALGVASAPSVHAKGGVGGGAKAGALLAPITGPAIGGLVPKGFARYRNVNGIQDFIVEAAPVNLPDGTILAVWLNTNPVPVTTMTVTLGTARSPLLASNLGNVVPVINRGDVVKVTNGGNVIMTGHF
jgi:hypothetical protein